jgi:hypothetical protein
MKFRLKKERKLSGNKASIYTIYILDEEKTLFDIFLEEYNSLLKNEIKDIVLRLKAIGNKTGARDQYFKLNEGALGDGVCALYDVPDKKLRLYCIKFGTLLLIIGGGGVKPKNIRALQENPKLTQENNIVKELSKAILERIKEGTIKYTEDCMDFIGNLEFDL